jgi:hypothetical protein
MLQDDHAGYVVSCRRRVVIDQAATGAGFGLFACSLAATLLGQLMPRSWARWLSLCTRRRVSGISW